MRIAVTGSTGLVGTAVTNRMAADGHTVYRVLRQQSAGDDAIQWNPTAGTIERAKFNGLDAVVHLAGENIADGRWTAAKKERIRDSRVIGTELLCRTLAGLKQPPRTLIAASAIGYYGDQGDRQCDESAGAGSGFLADVCAEWEHATEPAKAAGMRVVNLRIGVVLTPRGGAIKKMLLPFKLGGGGRVGSGRQYWSWISLDDVTGAIAHCLRTDSLAGPVNAVAPDPVTNLEFTKALGRALGRPTIVPMPAFAARLALGEMADELLLASTRVVPRRLLETGYRFQHTVLSESLPDILSRT